MAAYGCWLLRTIQIGKKTDRSSAGRLAYCAVRLPVYPTPKRDKAGARVYCRARWPRHIAWQHYAEQRVGWDS